MRQIIAKIRCSDHILEIEKGRHRNIPREERTCKTCTEGVIEDEEHFLLRCETYQPLRNKHNMEAENLNDFLNFENQEKLGKYLISAFELRENVLETI